MNNDTASISIETLMESRRRILIQSFCSYKIRNPRFELERQHNLISNDPYFVEVTYTTNINAFPMATRL